MSKSVEGKGKGMKETDRIRIEPNLTRAQVGELLECCLLLGFEAEQAVFPVTATKGDGKAVSLAELVAERSHRTADVPTGFQSATRQARPIPELDWRRRKGLETLFSIGEFLIDQNHDQLADQLNFKIRLPLEFSWHQAAAAANLAYRFGMDTTAYEGPILAETDWEGKVIEFIPGEVCRLTWEEGTGCRVLIEGDGEDLVELMAQMCTRFPEAGPGTPWIQLLQQMTDSLALRDLDGQLAKVRALQKQGLDDLQVSASSELRSRVQETERDFPGVTFVDHKAPRSLWEQSVDLTWEVQDLLDLLERDVYPRVTPGDEVVLEACLSEDYAVRARTSQLIQDHIHSLGAGCRIQLLCAYKQGYSWLEEAVLPQVRNLPIHEVLIRFRPFLAPGISDWGDVDGAVPSYQLGGGNPERWLDLPIRHLQELYPAHDLVTDALGLAPGSVRFEAMEDSTDSDGATYQFVGRNKAGDMVHEAAYTASWTERPYLTGYPGLGLVHPPTGHLRVWINGTRTVDQRITTDLEKVWDSYQNEILPRVRETILTRYGTVRAQDQPFFTRLELDVTLSEPDFALPWRQDMISSLNALHEDLYFVGSDYFRQLGLEHGDAGIDAPGLILPLIHQGQGKPQLTVRLLQAADAAPCIRQGGQILAGPLERRDIGLWLQGLSQTDGRLTAHLQTDYTDGDFLQAYLELLAQGSLSVNRILDGVNALSLTAPAGEWSTVLPARPVREKTVKITELDLMEDRVIGVEDFEALTESLRQVGGLSVYPIATSYEGRPIYAFELTTEEPGYTSRTRRLTRYPSLYINARHHANEVSSTNAALMLLRELLTDDRWQGLAQRLNLVVVPLENPDGTAIHYELQKEHPTWKLHVARFNAIGKEFYRDHFNPDTIHTEAMGLTRLWHRMLPDLMIDNHGVPSHEWEQPFSGYTSPAYKGFWIPRSLLYGYFWTVRDETWQENVRLNRSVEDVIAQAIQAEPELTAHNEAWKEIFETYAHRWMPRLFPADYYKNMINYWIAFDHDPAHRYPSVRFPWITSVAYTSEVADETAQGEYLRLCARAHLTHDLAVIEELSHAVSHYETECSLRDGVLRLKDIRHRPLRFRTDPDSRPVE